MTLAYCPDQLKLFEVAAHARPTGLIGTPFESLAGLSAHGDVLAEVERGVAEANSHLARPEQVRRWVLLPTEWTAQSGELTPSMKRKRRVIIDRYAKEIERLYD